MSVVIRRGVASLVFNNPSPLCFSLSLLSFSTSKETLPDNLRKYDFSPQVASRVASVLARCRNPEKSESVLSFLKENGFSNTQLEQIAKSCPRLLVADIEKIIKPKIKIFQDLGLSAREIAKIISSNPAILTRSIRNGMMPSLTVLKGLMGSNWGVSKLLKISSWFMNVDLDKAMVPNVDFLKSCGIPLNQIIRHICYSPWFILHNPEILRKSVEKADEMGFNRSSPRFMHAVRALTLSNESWELKLKTFRNFGFSEDEIFGMIFRNGAMQGIILVTVKWTTRLEKGDFLLVGIEAKATLLRITTTCKLGWNVVEFEGDNLLWQESSCRKQETLPDNLRKYDFSPHVASRVASVIYRSCLHDYNIVLVLVTYSLHLRFMVRYIVPRPRFPWVDAMILCDWYIGMELDRNEMTLKME
ncbi:hypothetical protein CDL12_04867 [Handroanthus impetiginosus]|uniref:Mitochondrial transcription termination factor, mTERF n=1 Tax=Handroanthus impetiginosus TaxID=429701 RepID=A0A2G9HY38_9LAMI|nr:hypothetical protein CDL12_04867 [Handroanthus impetiginosus]